MRKIFENFFQEKTKICALLTKIKQKKIGKHVNYKRKALFRPQNHTFLYLYYIALRAYFTPYIIYTRARGKFYRRFLTMAGTRVLYKNTFILVIFL